MEELEERMIRFLKIMEKHNLYFKWLKCNFNMEEIPILGVVIGREQVQMEANKVKAVKKWKAFWDSQISTDGLSRTSVMVKPLNELKGKKE